ncbi:hypothetical protein KL932_002901 [Ogataea haglerorum]|nr:hypothetical protein KL932_002901 [Ogataea haglerorum]KAG7800358.1 hypothetical protein KL944_003931 [Ogataea haglerorum]KAG7806677.1 hypothetical protein KL924_004291 [Ogataea haglerorum]
MSLSFVRRVHRFPFKSDISITRRGETRILQGSGGRSSRTGFTATVFGATGFLGRLLVAKLAKHGTILVCPFRNEMAKRQLKPMGDLGVVNYIECDIRNLRSLEESVCRSDIVFNLIGSDQNTKNFSMEDANVESIRRIAELCTAYEVPRLVHVSSYNADPNSKSQFFATKGQSEIVAREAFPDVTIVRPGPMYGRNSTFLNDLVPLQGFGENIKYRSTVYPAHGLQVAAALEKIGFDDSTTGKVYELHGNEPYSKAELREMLKYIRHLGMYGYFPAAAGYSIPTPEIVYKAWCWLNEKLNSNLTAINYDYYVRSDMDHKLDPEALTFENLDMVPDELADFLYKYVKPHILASSQSLNRTVYDRDEILKLRAFVNTPKDSFDLLNMKD